MVKRNNFIILFITLLFCVSAFSQDTLTLNVFVNNILNEHPYVKIANNKLSIYKQKLRAAKGAFDPKIKGSWDNKDYKQKEYYDIREVKLVAPTTIGLRPVVKYSDNTGLFLNPENNTPNSGLIGAGIEVPLLRGLFIDESRAELRRAKAGLNAQIFSNDSLLNQILYNAINDYINWTNAYNYLTVINDLVDTRNQRYTNVYNSYKGGASSPMDTLDAVTQLQKTIRDQLEAKTKLTKAYYKLLNNIWEDELKGKDFIPPNSLSIIGNISSTSSQISIPEHNFIQALNAKKQLVRVDAQYYREQFKPTLDIGAMALSTSTVFPEAVDKLSISNYLINVDFEIPLWFRKQAGYLKQAKLKMENIDYKIQYKQQELSNKFNAILIQEQLLKQQYDLSIQNVNQFKRLRDLEEIKFNLGESTLLKLNIRENKLFDEQSKAVSVTNKYMQLLIDKKLLLQEFQ